MVGLVEGGGRDLASLVAEPVECGAVSAVAVVVGSSEGIAAQSTAGSRDCGGGSPPSGASFFDLASLSKPITATLALVLDAERLLPLAARVGEVWERCDPRLARTPLSDLLRHRGGLIAWTPLYERLSARDQLEDLLLSGSLLGARKGTYSDLGYILWAISAAAALGRSPMSLVRRHVLRPLGLMRDVTDRPGLPSRTVSCTLDMRREAELAAAQGRSVSLLAPRRGEPQDGNARWLGGYSGHAGLFGSPIAMWKLANEWLCPRLLDPERVHAALGGRTRFALGWWRRTLAGSAGPGLDRRSFGHTGFTGGSLWIDPAAERIFAVLAHRTRSDVDLSPWRRRLHAWRPER